MELLMNLLHDIWMDFTASEMRTLHACITRLITPGRHSPWYTAALGDSERTCRRLERTWRSHRDSTSHRLYREYCCEMTKQLETDKTTYYSNKISDSKGNQKALFQISSKLLSNHQQARLPKCCNDLEL